MQPNAEIVETWEVPAYSQENFFPKRTRYAVLIPVLNEGERISRQLRDMQPYLPKADTFIIDGGSADGATSPEVLRGTGIRSLLVKTGPGRLSAQLRVGLAHAMKEGYEGVVLIDGNSKDNPDAIPRFIEELDAGYDHVQGSRFVDGGRALNNPAARVWGIKLLHAPLISLAAGVRYTDTTNGFRAYSRKFLLDPRVQPFRDIFSEYELHYYLAIRAGKLGFRVKEIGVERVYPKGVPTPTKIKGVKGNLKILKTLWSAVQNEYDPGTQVSK